MILKGEIRLLIPAYRLLRDQFAVKPGVSEKTAKDSSKAEGRIQRRTKVEPREHDADCVRGVINACIIEGIVVIVIAILFGERRFYE
ncbi:unnamed protein product [Sphagnum jensenii]|uniref:Uncharacterized protein n=1 Tax=Sphagnum jensenii TaxID=128206 RepID=A0ABP0V7V4_9BRYO